MGVIVCVPTIDGKITMMNTGGNLEPLAFMDSKSFSLMKAHVAKGSYGENTKDMGDHDLLLIEEDYESGLTYTILTPVGNELQMKSNWTKA